LVTAYGAEPICVDNPAAEAVCSRYPWPRSFHGSGAAVEFQIILDHPGIVFADPIGALARLQIGRAFAMSGDKTKAKASYQDFLTLWKEADPGIPILKQAKAEYAKL
jgi:hypothetical protein